MSDIRLICGDCLKKLPTLADTSIDLVLSDPPYGHSNNEGDLIHNREKALGEKKKVKKWRGRDSVTEQSQNPSRPIANDGPEANSLFRSVLPEFSRLLVPGGNTAICCGGGGPDPQAARWTMWLSKMLDFNQMVIWDKGPMGMGWHYRRSYEVVLVAQKPGAKRKWYDETDKVENIIRPGDYGIGKIIPSESDHPTPKPVELAMHFIRLHTQEGDTVLDPFCGAGWVGVACKLLKRKFIGIEIDPQWYGVAKDRIDRIRSLSDVSRRAIPTKRIDDPFSLGFFIGG